MTNYGEEYSIMTFFVDFDKKEYINGFEEIDVLEYLPNSSWIGKFDWDPINYIPAELIN